MSDVSFSGLSTGIDTASLIKALVEAKRRPVTMLQQQAASFQSGVDHLDEFAAKLTALRSAVTALTSTSTFAAFNATTSNANILSVAASSAASEGNHMVTVKQLARSQTTRSTTTSTISSTTADAGLVGNLTIVPNAPGVSVPSNTISIAAGDSLEEIRDKINFSSTKAYGSITLSGKPADNTKVTVDGKTYEFLDTSGSGTQSAGTILVDTNGIAAGDAAAAASALAGVATGANKGDNSTMTASGGIVTVLADSTGSVGNTIGMSVSGDAGVRSSGATLAGGGTPPYSASIINTGTSAAPSYNLILTGRGTGEASAFTASFSGSGLSFTNTQTAQDAILDVDGITDIHRGTNVVSDVISGVSMNLVDAPAEQPEISVVVGKDSASIRTKVQAFISAYNDLKSHITANTAFDQVTRKGGPLMGEMAVSTVSGGLSSILVSAVSGLSGNYTALSRIGITTKSDGTISMDAAKFDAALGNDFNGVVDLFAQNRTTGTKGVAYQVMSRIDRWMSPVDGVVSRRKSNLQETILRLNSQADQKESAVALYEQSLKLKYSNLEQLVSSMKDQSSSLNSFGIY
jgi:flagellar hook-associated protein 2